MRQLRAMVYTQVLAAAFSGLNLPAFCHTFSITSCTSSSPMMPTGWNPRGKSLDKRSKMAKKRVNAAPVLTGRYQCEAFAHLVGAPANQAL